MTVWLNSPGIVCALGDDPDTVRSRLYAGDTSGLRATPGWLENRTPFLGACEVNLNDWPAQMATHHDSRNNRLLLKAARQIESSIRHAVDRHGAHRVAIVLGTSTSGVNDNLTAFADFLKSGNWPDGYDYRRQVRSAPAAFLADWLQTSGPAYTISTACTSSARAFLSARSLLRMDLCDAVVCGGVDTLCRLTIGGFASLGAISDTLCSPFSADRNGINIGEAAVLFLMERTPSPDRAQVALLGGGASSDAWHMSSPEPSGKGACQAMTAALLDAGLTSADIGWVNLHGTGTQHNDAMESLAMDAIFPDAGVPCASTKALTGHALGTAGALEAALVWFSLTKDDGALPPHAWHGNADPALPRLDFSTTLHRYAAGKRRIAMSNSFAFGGSNVSLILGAGR
ncbi:beta-ketoacyl-[acyl-carrier-protein] synthase family protein [Azonexus sp.]|jgi:3-oxoacyl-[acyl-carrier-protein] synthase-1|uniref:beta-ketoacyl-[acyl-carrier-protein] synthase family protein n=1 Tax=Azonexus sp. TaxID=1872668 RepID=UPI00283634C4|nr:beta-ketoacyl-[acyl-carrier-protein] synthase family protein [Azonexus sp.]MDR1994326.1 beta-ketoacyl-[acyl-carrier-protein] synthase family protein [Azonexus sp.]